MTKEQKKVANKLLEMLASGRQPSREEMERYGRQAGADRGQRPEQQPWLTREMLRRMGLEELAEQIEKLLEELARMGMDIARLRDPGRVVQDYLHRDAEVVGQPLREPHRDTVREMRGPAAGVPQGDADQQMSVVVPCVALIVDQRPDQRRSREHVGRGRRQHEAVRDHVARQRRGIKRPVRPTQLLAEIAGSRDWVATSVTPELAVVEVLPAPGHILV